MEGKCLGYQLAAVLVLLQRQCPTAAQCPVPGLSAQSPPHQGHTWPSSHQFSWVHWLLGHGFLLGKPGVEEDVGLTQI